MKEEKVMIVKAKAVNPKNRKKEEQKESFNMKDNTNQNSNVRKLQDNNINGNYGRIYIQEGQKKNLVYQEYDVPSSSNTNVLRDKEKPSTKYTKLNPPKTASSTRYSNSLDKNAIKKNKSGRDEDKKASQLKRKSIDRGGNYKNIQVTHIIDSTFDIDFHITDPLVEVTEENKKKYRGHLNKSNRNGKDGKVRVTCTCSCDNVKIKPKEKKKNVGKVEVVTHRENPHLKRVNVNKVNTTNTKTNPVNNYSIKAKTKYNRTSNRTERK